MSEVDQCGSEKKIPTSKTDLEKIDASRLDPQWAYRILLSFI
jgi:hypothetical protein